MQDEHVYVFVLTLVLESCACVLCAVLVGHIRILHQLSCLRSRLLPFLALGCMSGVIYFHLGAQGTATPLTQSIPFRKRCLQTYEPTPAAKAEFDIRSMACLCLSLLAHIIQWCSDSESLHSLHTVDNRLPSPVLRRGCRTNPGLLMAKRRRARRWETPSG